MTVINRFKKVGILEGWSFILLMGIAVPMKHVFDMPDPVKYLGWVHGVLFILYLVFLYLAADSAKWSFKTIALGFLAALLPFGPFAFHGYLNRLKRG
jgi:integral membrane protein